MKDCQDFIEVVAQDPDTKKALKLWQRAAFYDPATAEIFFPVEMALGPSGFWSALFDGVPMISSMDHAYVPLSWIKAQRPESDFSNIERGIRECARKIAPESLAIKVRGQLIENQPTRITR